MKNPSPPTSPEHPDALLLPYVEDLIAPADRAGVEEHLSTCQECTARVEGLREMISALRENKRAFCPEPWQLHVFAQSGEDLHGTISTHVDDCPFCSEDLRAWKGAALEERMPSELWGRLRQRLPEPAQERIPSGRPRWSQMVLEKLARFWKAPTLAAGAVAALLLVVVILYRPMEPTVPIPKTLPQKTAFVVLFKDFNDPALQKQIESLHDDLKTSTELKDRYIIVSPAETSEVIESGKAPSHDRSAMIDGLKRNLNVSRVLIVSIFPSADKFAFRVELINTITGKALQAKTEEKIEQSELEARIRSDVHSMLLQPDEQP